ncbi:hypothetical protein BDV40DRAFT_270705, partial [Aspergillus tamarii]
LTLNFFVQLFHLLSCPYLPVLALIKERLLFYTTIWHITNGWIGGCRPTIDKRVKYTGIQPINLISGTTFTRYTVVRFLNISILLEVR